MPNSHSNPIMYLLCKIFPEQGRIPLPYITYIGRKKTRERKAHIHKHAHKRKKKVKQWNKTDREMYRRRKTAKSKKK